MEKASNFVITISRQKGIGGAYIGQQLARNLNIFYADREIIRQAAKQFSILEEDLESCEEKKSSFWESFMHSYGLGYPDSYVPPKIILPPDLAIFEAEKEIIAHIVKERSAVIIGRCGAHILREHPNHLSIFLHGDINFRKSRIQQLYHVTEQIAEKMIVQSDKERSLYYRSFTGKEWTDASQYDISINTSKTGIERTVKLIMEYIHLL